jgi:hypothetical protein
MASLKNSLVPVNIIETLRFVKENVDRAAVFKPGG